jgi:hypothetical protein
MGSSASSPMPGWKRMITSEIMQDLKWGEGVQKLQFNKQLAAHQSQ